MSSQVTRSFIQQTADWLTVKKFLAALIAIVMTVFMAGFGASTCYRQNFASPDSIDSVHSEMQDSIAAVRTDQKISDAVSDSTTQLVSAFSDSLNAVNRKLNYLICKDKGNTTEVCLRQGAGMGI